MGLFGRFRHPVEFMLSHLTFKIDWCLIQCLILFFHRLQYLELVVPLKSSVLPQRCVALVDQLVAVFHVKFSYGVFVAAGQLIDRNKIVNRVACREFLPLGLLTQQLHLIFPSQDFLLPLEHRIFLPLGLAGLFKLNFGFTRQQSKVEVIFRARFFADYVSCLFIVASTSLTAHFQKQRLLPPHLRQPIVRRSVDTEPLHHLVHIPLHGDVRVIRLLDPGIRDKGRGFVLARV